MTQVRNQAFRLVLVAVDTVDQVAHPGLDHLGLLLDQGLGVQVRPGPGEILDAFVAEAAELEPEIPLGDRGLFIATVDAERLSALPRRLPQSGEELAEVAEGTRLALGAGIELLQDAVEAMRSLSSNPRSFCSRSRLAGVSTGKSELRLSLIWRCRFESMTALPGFSRARARVR